MSRRCSASRFHHLLLPDLASEPVGTLAEAVRRSLQTSLSLETRSLVWLTRLPAAIAGRFLHPQSGPSRQRVTLVGSEPRSSKKTASVSFVF
jgi:hypothetical protein